MYQNFHSLLFNYSDYIGDTNIKSIQVMDNGVEMTSRDRGIKIKCIAGDKRNHPFEILNFMDVEIDEINMMNNMLQNNAVIFDIGANIGWHSLNLAVASRDRQIYSFEPVLSTYDSLLENLNINKVKNVRAYNLGFSKEEGVLDFYFKKGVTGNSSLKNLSEEDDVVKIKCNIKILDKFIYDLDLQHLDFIKCDVEGAELLVFQGALNVLKKYKPVVFAEILRKWAYKFSYDPNEIFNLFTSIDYCAFTIKHGKLIEFNRMTEDTVDTNFFFLEKNKHKSIIQKFLN